MTTAWRFLRHQTAMQWDISAYVKTIGDGRAERLARPHPREATVQAAVEAE
jgi:hypothetical protein